MNINIFEFIQIIFRKTEESMFGRDRRNMVHASINHLLYTIGTSHSVALSYSLNSHITNILVMGEEQ